MRRPTSWLWAGFVLSAVATLAAAARAHAEPAASERERQELQGLYTRHGSGALWSRAGQPSRQALAVLELLRHAETYGLRPADYAVDAAATGTPAADRALSLAALRFLHHVHAGRVDPRAAGFELGLQHSAFDAADAVARLAVADDPGTVVAAAEPQFYHYQLLKQALAQYRAIASGPPLPRLPDLPRRSIRPGEDYAGIPALRARLAALGDLETAALPGDGGRTLDPALVAALKRFETRHQLEDDGVLGRSVLEELNVPVVQRIRQIELALERWRWLPPLQVPPIVVNIPQFRLFAFHTTSDRAADILQMDVIVGQAFRRTQTPVFAGSMKYVIFRPYWDVPYSIARREILPKLAADPGYLAREQLEIVAGPDDAAQPLPPTAENLQRVRAGSLRLRQRPGPDNSLGLVKFMLPNEHNVYLHSTPARRLFGRPMRAFSHGCIRVSDPVALAAYVLRDTPGGWTPDRIEAAMNGAESRRVDLARPIPVLIVYATALATEAGSMLFFHDIYGNDRLLEKLLGLEAI